MFKSSRTIFHVYPKARNVFWSYRNCSGSGNQLVLVSFNNGIKNLVMNDLKTRNSLSLEMMDQLTENISECDNQVRMVVISANGPVFSAGHNFKELTPEAGKKQHEKVFEKSSQLMSAIIDSPVPILAKVDGVAAAAGCQLMAQCDLVVCSERSTFSTPGVNYGIFCSTPGVAISRSVPKKFALYMLLTGATINSEEAKMYGLVTKVCPADKLDQEVDSLCDSIKEKSRSVIEIGKTFYYKQIEHDVKTAYKMGGKCMVDNINSEDGVEGIRSFVLKKKPKWNK